MQPSQYPQSLSAEFAARIKLIERHVHQQRDVAQQLIDQLLAESRAQHDALAFVTAVELQSQIAFAQSSINLQYEALQMAQSHHLFAAEARILCLIGRAYYAGAQYHDALQTWARCLEVAELSQQYTTWVKAKMGVGQIYDALGDAESAIKMHREAIVRSETLGDAWLLLQAHINLGVNLHRLARSDEALASFEFALTTARELHHEDDEAESLMRMAEVLLSRESFARALAALEAAQTIAEKTGYRWALAQILRLRAECLLRTDQPHDALHWVLQGIRVAEQAGAMHARMSLLYLHSEISEQLGDAAGALRIYRQAQGLERQIAHSAQRDPLQQVAQVSGLLHNPDQELLELASNLSLGDADLAHLAQILCATACKVLQVAQSSFWQWSNADTLHCLVRSGAQGDALPAGPDIHRDDLPSLCQCLQQGEMIIAHASEQHLYTWQWSELALCEQNIAAVLLIPVRLGDETIAVLACEHLLQQRNWRREEVQHAQQLGLLATRALAQYQQQYYVQQIAGLNTRLTIQNDELEIRVQERTQALQQAMQKLVQAEKLAALGNLVAGFAHELNTPLGSVLTAATTLSERSSEISAQMNLGTIKKSDFEHFIDDGMQISSLIERNARRASELIVSLKQLASDQPLQDPSEIWLKRLAEQVIGNLSPRSKACGVVIFNEIDPELRLLSYRVELELILHQLIQNSLLHAFEGQNDGQIVIRSESHPAASSGVEQLVLIYQDNGAGIASEALDKVFDPFYTTKFGQGRSGLGLYQVYSLVHGKLNGEISISSQIGQGTEIHISLPRKALNMACFTRT